MYSIYADQLAQQRERFRWSHFAFGCSRHLRTASPALNTLPVCELFNQISATYGSLYPLSIALKVLKTISALSSVSFTASVVSSSTSPCRTSHAAGAKWSNMLMVSGSSLK